MDDNAAVKSSLDDRLLAEAVRVMERDPAIAVANDAVAARTAGLDATAAGDLEQRIVARAAALPSAATQRDANLQLRRVFRGVVVACTILALLAGAAAARAALGAANDQAVNVFWALGNLLGVQMVLLLVWFALLLLGARGLALGSLGSFVVHLAQGLARRLRGATPEQTAALHAAGAVLSRPDLARWTFSAISHALWTAFNLGCVLVLALLLSTKRYTFIWETTILDAETYQRLTNLLAAGPALLGFATPTPQQVADTVIDAPTENIAAAKHAWSGLLLGAMIVYGLMPRALLAAASWLGRARSLRRYRLDLLNPGFQRLAPLLMPQTRALGIVDGDENNALAAARSAPPLAASRPPGPPAILGLEIAPPPTGWPPRLPGLTLTDLGLIDDRDAQHRCIANLRVAATEPRCLIVVASLTTTPDRGIGSFLRELGRASSNSLSLVLTGGDSLRKRGGARQLEQRISDWRQLAIESGMTDARIAEIDLDHLTDASRAVLAALVDGKPGAISDRAVSQRRLEQSFMLIAAFAQTQRSASDMAARTELHQSIARLYQHEQNSWRKLFAAPSALTEANFRSKLEQAASRVTDLLPPRLRVSPTWLAAGAAAGALGCIAAASLVAPAAIAALPMWSAIGAAVGTAVNIALKRGAPIESPQSSVSAAALADAVRAAALFAMLLELQSRGEAAITRILDRAIDDGKLPAIIDAVSARAWLDELQHRFDLALAAEATA